MTKAYNFALDDITLHSLNNVEIFRSGVWNDEQYTNDDLIQMESNFNMMLQDNPDFSLPLKLGHQQSDQEPAIGQLNNVKVIGNRMFADLTALPEAVFKFIKLKGFKNRSVEILQRYGKDGKVSNRLLKGMALLGAQLPGVNLRDVENGAAGLNILGKALYGKLFAEEDTDLHDIIIFEEGETMEYVTEMGCGDKKMGDMSVPTETVPTETLPSETLPSETLPSETLPEAPTAVEIEVNPNAQDMAATPSQAAIMEVKSQLDALQKKVEELTSTNMSLNEKLESYKEAEIKAELENKMSFVDGLIESNQILPAQKELVFGLLKEMDTKEVTINFSDGSVQTDVSVNLFKSFLTSLPSNGLLNKSTSNDTVMSKSDVLHKFSMEQFNKAYSELSVQETREVLSKVSNSPVYNKL